MANKGEIRNLILEQVDWNPNQSTDFKSKVDRLINRAYQAMSLEAPFLFFEEEARIVTAPDQRSHSQGRIYRCVRAQKSLRYRYRS